MSYPRGYPRDLDEFDDVELTDELNRRIRLRRKGLCDFCGQPVKSEPCRMPERHRRFVRHHPDVMDQLNGVTRRRDAD